MKNQKKLIGGPDIYNFIETVEEIARITGQKKYPFYHIDSYENNGEIYSCNDVKDVMKNLLKERCYYYSLANILKASQKTNSKVPALLLCELLNYQYREEINSLDKIETLLNIRSIVGGDRGYYVQQACDQKLDKIYMSKLQETSNKNTIEKILKSIEKNLNPYNPGFKSYVFGSKKLVSIYKLEANDRASFIELQDYINDVKNRIPGYINGNLETNLFTYLSKRLIKLNRYELTSRLENTDCLKEIHNIKQIADNKKQLFASILCKFKSQRMFKKVSKYVSNDSDFANLYQYCPMRLRKNFLMKWSRSIDRTSDSNITVYLEYLNLSSSKDGGLNILDKQLVAYFENKNDIDELCQAIDKTGRVIVARNTEIKNKVIRTIKNATIQDLRLHGNSLLLNLCNEEAMLAFVNRLLYLDCSTQDIANVCVDAGYSIKQLVAASREVDITISLVCKEEIMQANDTNELKAICEHINNCNHESAYKLRDLAITKARHITASSTSF